MGFVEIEQGQQVDQLPVAATHMFIPLDVLVEHRHELKKLTALQQLTIKPPFQGRDPYGRLLSSRLWRSELPDELADIPKLKLLDLHALGLERLPERLLAHPTLEVISINNSRFVSLAEIAQRSKPVIRAEHCRLSRVEERWLGELAKLPPAQRREAPAPKTKKQKAVPGARRLAQPEWEAIGPLVLSGDGTTILAGQRGGFGVCAWDVASGTLLWTRALGTVETEDIEAYTAISIDPSGFVLATFSLAPAGLHALDPKTGKTVRTTETQSFPWHQVVTVDGQQHLITLMYTYFHTGVFGYPEPGTPFAADGPIANFSADLSRAAIAARQEQQIRVFTTEAIVRKQDPLATIKAPTASAHALTPDGKQLIVVTDGTGDDDDDGKAEVRVFDVAKGKVVARFPWAEDLGKTAPKLLTGTRLAIDASGKRLALARIADKGKLADTIAIFDLASGTAVAVLPAHERERGRMDPTYGALYARAWSAHPSLLFVGDELAVGSVIRADDEPRVGTGLTLHKLDR